MIIVLLYFTKRKIIALFYKRLLFYSTELTLFIVLFILCEKIWLLYYVILWKYLFINAGNKIKLIIVLFYSTK